MLARTLLIEVRLFDGRYHGVGDWPPSPFRLFQALVAGAYGGRWAAEPAEEAEKKDAAFRWLESLGPPQIAAPAKQGLPAVTYFVPNNDLDAVGGDLRRIAAIRTAKIVRPIVFDPVIPFLYAWWFDTGEEHAKRLCDLAEQLHTFGRGIDAGFAQGEILDAVAASARLAAHGGPIANPVSAAAASGGVPCPAPGSLDSLKARHEAARKRFQHQREGRSTTTLFRQAPKAHFRMIAYNRPASRLLFDLTPADGVRRFRPIAQERATEIATAVRDLAVERLKGAFPNRAAEIDRIVIGRGAASGDLDRRVRFLPLPTIGFEHADPAIRRVLVEVPPDCPFPARDIGWSLSGQALERADPITGEITVAPGMDGIVLTPAENTAMLRHYGIPQTPDEAARPARRWRTVTPAALPVPRPRGRVSGEVRATSESEAAGAVVHALRHAGIEERPAEIRVQREPLHVKGALAQDFYPDRFDSRALWHVEVTLARPVRGPLAIGDGRFLGLGLMRPDLSVRRSIFVFALDSDRGPISPNDRSELLRAVRRALMALARASDGSIERLFSGHEPDGAAARSGRHDHVFLAAHGENGLDRLYVIAPWAADQTVQPERGSQRRFEEVVSSLSLLRAGRLGLIRLAGIDLDTDRDPLVTRSLAWVSRTSYAPNRHPKAATDTMAFVADDIRRAILDRGLPEPEVEIARLTIGPRGGIRAEVRLCFRVAIPGPLLLGRDCHFGGGLFVATDTSRR